MRQGFERPIQAPYYQDITFAEHFNGFGQSWSLSFGSTGGIGKYFFTAYADGQQKAIQAVNTHLLET